MSNVIPPEGLTFDEKAALATLTGAAGVLTAAWDAAASDIQVFISTPSRVLEQAVANYVTAANATLKLMELRNGRKLSLPRATVNRSAPVKGSTKGAMDTNFALIPLLTQDLSVWAQKSSDRYGADVQGLVSSIAVARQLSQTNRTIRQLAKRHLR